MEPALKQFYKEKVAPHLKAKLGVTNPHQIPQIEKVVVNCSVGKQADRKQAVEDAVARASDWGAHPLSVLAQKEIAALRERVRPVLLRRRKHDVETELPIRTDRQHFINNQNLRLKMSSHRKRQPLSIDGGAIIACCEENWSI